MKIVVLGAGMMGRAIAHDLCKYSNFDSVAIADRDRKTLQSAEKFLKGKKIDFLTLDVNKTNDVKKLFQNYDVAILVAGDQDYIPLVDAVMAEGARVVLWFLEKGLHPALKRKADYYFDLGLILLEYDKDTLSQRIGYNLWR